MTSTTEISDFESRISSMIKTNTENMINIVLSFGDNLHPEALECLARIETGEKMLEAAKKLPK